MLETSARLLRLLSLLQSRPDWPGPELAERLGVTTRTVRRDVDRLRELGYPVEAVSGVAGGYRLGVGAALPPLLLDDDEAVAIAVGLRAAASGSIAGMEETSLRALAKLEQVLPSRLRHRVAAMQSSVMPLTGPGPAVPADLLASLAGSCRAHEGVRFRYQGSPRRVEPYRLVHTGSRWYLLAFDLDRDDWRTFRVDRMESAPEPGARFHLRRLPAEDLNAYVTDKVSSSPYRYQARILFHVPIEVAAERTAPTAGRLVKVDEDTCMFFAGAASLDVLAVYVALKGFDFEVLDPPELVEHVAALGARLARAATTTTTTTASEPGHAGPRHGRCYFS